MWSAVPALPLKVPHETGHMTRALVTRETHIEAALAGPPRPMAGPSMARECMDREAKEHDRSRL